MNRVACLIMVISMAALLCSPAAAQGFPPAEPPPGSGLCSQLTEPHPLHLACMQAIQTWEWLYAVAMGIGDTAIGLVYGLAQDCVGDDGSSSPTPMGFPVQPGGAFPPRVDVIVYIPEYYYSNGAFVAQGGYQSVYVDPRC